jgi:hypothetical protein
MIIRKTILSIMLTTNWEYILKSYFSLRFFFPLDYYLYGKQEVPIQQENPVSTSIEES